VHDFPGNDGCNGSKPKIQIYHSNLLCGGKNILHTIYVIRIILRPLSALFGLQFMLPMEKSVTFTGTCANEIIPNG
jgi:hypothetical protein